MISQTTVRFGYPNTLIREYEYWTVLLREQQVTLGSLVLCAKSDVTEFSALPSNAFIEMGVVIKDIERVLKAVFEYDKINYLMLMMVDPNVHFHVIPRYAEERSACGLKISDSGWPATPNLGDSRELTSVERDNLCSYIINLW
jgi:diadenosine tetraphosphate (Ap4A) HIT family hydrolase